ncbi:transcription initiation factor TFIID subunit 15-like [Syzygium oleosum]|uniref:transcription initiation factor TFIID subunit 15-like n=1 Tax=Syzygium oleosum TaxID=219896 RepID=UPI0011D22C6E|nr:transcription initiation factor TFIID subunit 15-like [Syzygium oleosum]
MSRPGDWNCQSCHHLNFQRRDLCQRCGEPRPSSLGGGRSNSSFRSGAAVDVKLGDWYCGVGGCGAHNFASRLSCFKCGMAKDESPTGGGYDGDMPRMRGFGYGSGSSASRPGWKPGDWICGRPGCNEHNFASRTECFRCNAPRESGGNSCSSS